MYINVYIYIFNFAYLFVLFFLSFSYNIFVNFTFTALFHNWHLALDLFSSLCLLVLFLTVKYNFWFPSFPGSIYCTLFLLNCFDFAYGYICVCVYSVTLFIVVINLCFYIGLLRFFRVFLFFFFFFLFSFL